MLNRALPTPSPATTVRARRIGMAVGVLLLVGAIALAWQRRDVVSDALGTMQQLPTGELTLYISIVLGSVAANLLLTGLLFNALIASTSGPKRVGLIEMQALIATATLLNFVPLRPGLLGRVAYHRLYNDIPVRDSAKVVVQSVILSAACATMAMVAVLIAAAFANAFVYLAAAPLAVLAALAILLPRSFTLMMAACALRYLDLLCTAARYWAAFALIGLSIDARGSLAFAVVSMIATMVPFLSNGLGLREWAVGLLAPVMTSYQMTLGVTADLLIRAAELIMIVVAGVIGLIILMQIRRSRENAATAHADHRGKV